MDPNLLNRARGCVVGAVVGDALGMPLEGCAARAADRLVRDMADGRLAAGTFTDDTEMALAMAESLLYCKCLDPDDVARRFVSWYQNSPNDVGFHTATVLSHIASGESWKNASETTYQTDPNNSAGNGSIMRCWPIALFDWKNLDQLVFDSILQSKITHSHPECVAASALINSTIYYLLQGLPIKKALANVMDVAGVPQELRELIEYAPCQRRELLKNSGWVRDTLQSVAWAILTTNSFEDALVQTINLGNDADTAGGVAGALAGALYGINSIPARWSYTVHGEWPIGSGVQLRVLELRTLADRLIDIPGSL